MTEQNVQPTPGEPAQRPEAPWGAPAAEGTAPRWSWKKTAAATAVAVGVATAGGFAVYAAGGASAEGTQRGPGGGPGGTGGPGGGMGGGPGGGGLAGALHGEFVVADGDGYATRVVQTGEVTAISDTSITAKSADGYTRTYVIDADTVRSAQDSQDSQNSQNSQNSVANGDTVTVIATPSGDTATAESVLERGERGAMGPGAGAGGQQGVPPRERSEESGVPAPPGN